MEINTNILIIHNHYKLAGGEDTVVENEAQLLRRHGYNVLLYTRSNCDIDSFTVMDKLLLPFSSIFSWRTYREVSSILKQQNISLIHVHNTLSLISPSVYWAAFKYHVPVVQTLHNFRLLCPNATFMRAGKCCEECLEKGLHTAVIHKCYRNSRLQTLLGAVILKVHRLLGTYRKLYYICLSEFNKEKLLKVNRGKKHIVDISRVFVKPNFCLAHADIVPFENRKNYFVYIGRLEILKGIYLLLQAWRNVEGSELHLYGTGPEEEGVKEFIHIYGLKKVRLFGHTEHNTLMHDLSYAKALILPTQCYEGMPMSIIESYACGTPVIGSNIGNTNQMILEGYTGISFQYDSPEALSRAVQTLPAFNSFDIFRHYEEHYGAESNYKLLKRIYDHVIADSSQVRH
ncbi:glycosyltransferase family 4 protein [Lachnotalea sp. AF33-28]|uniref:glycosyltransferase family 4 protein n=1 Tax=Lachnotalea sp. AF33-28 TaxID=2292046 RepID=UPI000E4B6EEA|nr:glycosyltransferase family 4 protein [Lachnotalea sp. AF33-28]RHP34970.1 glycosyltransferase [Lachnotalea sp. AF33-28]